MRTIGLDLGRRRSGIALSDESGLLAAPHATVDEPERLIETLARLRDETAASVLVVGLPVGRGGLDTDQTRWVREEATRIAARLGMELVLWDERLTTREALRRVRESGRRPSRQRVLADAASAAIILQSYLDSKRQGEPAERDV